MATALYDLHSAGVVHCDVKPANLAFFPTDHTWKLLDIDAAMDVDVAGDIITTISYASPEVLEAVEEGLTELALQTSADMWAYGIIAFEVFTGACLRCGRGFDLVRGVHIGKRFYEFEPTVESVLEFLRSGRFKQRLEVVKDRRQKHFIKKFLKWNALERQTAQRACTSTVFDSATVTVSKP